MCYSLAYIEKRGSKLLQRYNTLLAPYWKSSPLITVIPAELPVFYFVSGFEHPNLPVVTQQGISLCSWGLIPFWSKDEMFAKKVRSGTLNAMGETVFKKPSFRNSIRMRRGLLPVNGFFEWREYQGKKYPYFISLLTEGLFSLACIYDTWTNPATGEIMNTFSVITCPANPLMEIIHNKKKRMPLILDDEAAQIWLNPKASQEIVETIIKPFSENMMTAYPVSRMLNYVRNPRNTPEAIAAFEYPELPELISFKP